MPQHKDESRKLYLTWSLTPVRTGLEPAMQSVLVEKKNSNHKFGGWDWMDRFGKDTFEWPALHEVKQKPLDPKDMDNNKENHFLGHGGHMTLALFIEMQGGDKRSAEARQRRSKARAKARQGWHGWMGQEQAAVAAAHSPGTIANQAWPPSAVAGKSSSANWDCIGPYSWQPWDNNSPAVAEAWRSNPTVHSHTGQDWHGYGWDAGGNSYETSNTAPWEEGDCYEDVNGSGDEEAVVECQEWQWVKYVPNPDWCLDNNVENIEYNRARREFRFTTPDPWHQWYAWRGGRFGEHLDIYGSYR
jgi:hypothetical protein